MSGFFLIKGDDPKGDARTEITGSMLVGRSDDAALRVTEGHPSRRHAMLTVNDDGLWVEDLGSANGTRVNGAEISTRTLLHNGDQVAFDLAVFVVEAPVPVEAEPDGDVTVIRRMPASNATIIRPVPAAAPASAAPGSAVAASAAAPAVSPSVTSGEHEPAAPPPLSEAEALQKHVPRSWADPDYQGDGTRILSADEMRAMASGGGNLPATPGEAPAPMHIEGAHLVILAGPAAGMGFPLDEDQNEWSIGTADERDIRLEFSGVSAFHAKISQEGGRWRIIDQMSANGTWVNGQKSTISYLQDGDKLRFAQVECEIRIPSGKRGSGKGARNKSSGVGSSGTGATRMIVIGVAKLWNQPTTST